MNPHNSQLSCLTLSLRLMRNRRGVGAKLGKFFNKYKEILKKLPLYHHFCKKRLGSSAFRVVRVGRKFQVSIRKKIKLRNIFKVGSIF